MDVVIILYGKPLISELLLITVISPNPSGCYPDIVMGLPTKVLCKDDCRGLCPDCGKDLNLGDCGCQKKEVDPRLAALADLLKD